MLCYLVFDNNLRIAYDKQNDFFCIIISLVGGSRPAILNQVKKLFSSGGFLWLNDFPISDDL